VQQDNPANVGREKTWRSQTAATALQMSVAAPVRARIIKIQADMLGQREQLRRAVHSASNLTVRLSVSTGAESGARFAKLIAITGLQLSSQH